MSVSDGSFRSRRWFVIQTSKRGLSHKAFRETILQSLIFIAPSIFSRSWEPGWEVPISRAFWCGVANVIDRATMVFQETGDGRRRSLAAWGAEIIGLLCEIYAAREFDRHDPLEYPTLEVLRRICAEVAEQELVPDSIMPQLTAAQAIGQLLDQLSRGEIPALPDDQAVELLGWLEFPLDTAPALIVTSFNEGFVPKSVNSDLFLPNALRQQLGLVDNLRRYARDAYALSVLVASRESLQLIVGRRSMDDDPLVPSRLAFATDLRR